MLKNQNFTRRDYIVLFSTEVGSINELLIIELSTFFGSEYKKNPFFCNLNLKKY